MMMVILEKNIGQHGTDCGNNSVIEGDIHIMLFFSDHISIKCYN